MPTPKRRLLALTASLLALQLVRVERVAGGGADDIVIGTYASLTGTEATFGVNSNNGVLLATEEINAAGGLLDGRKIRLVVEDDQSKPGQSISAVKKLISNDKVVAIIGEIASSRSMEAAPVCQKRRHPDDLARGPPTRW